ALDLMRLMCGAVGYAHSRGVVHRDIKPSNVLLTLRGIPKLVDFGLARIGAKSDLSQTGLGMGTLAYVAPEQMTDAKSADHRSDIYSLGKTFYEVLTGESPETVDYEMVPKLVRDILRKCLRTKPDERYPSADDIVQDIDNLKAKASKSPTYFDELGPGECAACGGTNDADAQFCAFCGLGLFSECPSCAQEVRTGLRFCKHCRTEIPVFLEIEGHLEVARKCMDRRKYAGVVKSCCSILEIDGDHEEAKQMMEIAREVLQRLRVLELAMEEAIEMDDIQHAQQLFQRAEALTDSTTWLRQQNEMLAEAIILLDMQDARSKLEEGFYSDALWSARQALKLGAEDAEELIEFIDEKKKTYTVSLTKASEMISLGKYEEVGQILAEYRDQPGFEAAHDLIGRAEDAKGAVHTAIEKARHCLESGRFEEGLRACDEAMRAEGRRKDAEALKRELESRKKEIDDLLEQGNARLSSQEYSDSLPIFQQVKDRMSDEGAIERVRAEEGTQAAEDALADINEALDEARRKMDAGDLEGSLQECERVVALQANNEQAIVIKEELDHRKIHKTALSLAEEAYQAGNFSRAIQLWAAMRKADPDAPNVTKRLEEAQDALQRQKIRRMGVVAVSILVCVLVVMAYVFIKGSDPLAEARSLVASGKYAEAIRVIESLRRAGENIPGASLLETDCRFELAFKDLRAAIDGKRWREIVGLMAPLRKGLYGAGNRRKLRELFDGEELLARADELMAGERAFEVACIYSVLHLARPAEGHDKRAYRELKWLADDFIAHDKFDEARKLAGQAKELLGGRELENVTTGNDKAPE
ncbi:protein kinase, partial [Planctomycetota bacterium]